jgi:hypothetical protein
MPRQVKGPDGIVRTFPDDATDDEISAALSTPDTGRALIDINTDSLPGLRDRIAGALPNAGAMAGSLVGSFVGQNKGGTVGRNVGGVAGAAAGGALGKGAEMLMDSRDQGVGEGLRAMGTEALKQGAMEGGGQAAGGALKLLGYGSYRMGAAMLPKTIKQQFGNIGKAGFREGIPLTGWGAEKAGQRAGQVSDEVRDRLAMMDRAGMQPIDVASEVGPSIDRTAAKVANQPLRAADQASIAEFRQALRAENPNPIDLVASHDMKRAAQKQATQGYRQMDRGAPIQSLPLDLNMDVAHGLREAIESRVPDVGPKNQRIQDLMGVELGATHASSTAHVVPRLGAAAVLGAQGGFIPAALGMAASTPQGLTTAGVGLKKLAPVASHAPQAARLWALLQALSGEP